jgi:excisionase family DNA binding protein
MHAAAGNLAASRIPTGLEELPMSPDPLLLSVEEGAAQLRIGRSRMFDLIRRGKVLSVKVGGSRRIPYDSLKAYVDELVREQGSDAGDDRPAA